MWLKFLILDSSELFPVRVSPQLFHLNRKQSYLRRGRGVSLAWVIISYFSHFPSVPDTPTVSEGEPNMRWDLCLKRPWGETLVWRRWNIDPVQRNWTFCTDTVETEKAREYADQGKKLHIPEGAHFVWEHCFDILSSTWFNCHCLHHERAAE